MQSCVFPMTAINKSSFAIRKLGISGCLLLTSLFSAGMLYGQGSTQSIQGRVLNGTTNRPAAKVKVNYVLMQQGPTPLSTQVTDAEGRFHFDNVPAPSGGAPALLRAEYQGAVYSQPMLPQQSAAPEIEITVFEAENRPDLISVKEHAIFLHPSGGTLLVLEQIILENKSQPPKTYVNPKGTFPFTLPGQVKEGVRVSVQGPEGMPINQTPEPRDEKDRFAVTYPIRPGETQVRLEYALDYKSPFQFSKRLDVQPQQIHVVTPGKGVQLSGEVLTAMGTDPQTGFTGYLVTPKGNIINLQISGDVPPEVAGEGEASGGESAALVPIPDPISKRRWIVLSAAGLVMAIGLVYHYRQK